MRKPSRKAWIWISWAVATAVIEILTYPHALSWHLWKLFPKPRWRWVLVGLMSLLTWHFLSGPDVKPIAWQP